MGRLIDSDELVKFLKGCTMSNGTLINTNTMLSVIDKMPTAYDVDAVVKELEEETERYYKEFEKATDTLDIMCYGNMSNAYFHAISIVRKGGAE